MGFPFSSATSILTESLPYRPLHREQEFTGPRQENPASSQAEWKSIHGSVGSGSCHFGYGFRGLSPSFTSNMVGPCLQFQHYANRAPQNPSHPESWVRSLEREKVTLELWFFPHRAAPSALVHSTARTDQCHSSSGERWRKNQVVVGHPYGPSILYAFYYLIFTWKGA